MQTTIERRGHARWTEHVPALWTIGMQTDFRPSTILDRSSGGLSLKTPNALIPGSDLLIKEDRLPLGVVPAPRPPKSLRAEVIWTRKYKPNGRPAHYVSGTRFIDRFWEHAYDDGLPHLNPLNFQMSYTCLIKPTFLKFADLTAVSYRGVNLTYSDLDHRANQFAHMLIHNGLGKGDVVTINLPNTPEFVIAWLGALKAGCVVSGLSPFLSRRSMRRQLRDSRAKVIVTLPSLYQAKIHPIAATLPDLRIIVTTAMDNCFPRGKRLLNRLQGKSPHIRLTRLSTKQCYDFADILNSKNFATTAPMVKLGPDDLAYLQYPPHNTDQPLGVPLTHRNIVAMALIMDHWLGWLNGGYRLLSGFALHHAVGQAFCFFSVYAGNTQILVPDPRDSQHICAELKKQRPEMLAHAPRTLRRLMQHTDFRRMNHACLKICFTCASRPNAGDMDRLEAVVGSGKVVSGLGLTECAPFICAGPAKKRQPAGTIGLPVLNTDIKITDPQTGKAVGVGTPGELRVRGPQVMAGYHQNPAKTAQVFDSQGFFKTGIRGYFTRQGYIKSLD